MSKKDDVKKHGSGKKSAARLKAQFLNKNLLNFIMTLATIVFVDILEIEIIVMLKDFIESIESRDIELLYEVLVSGIFHILAYVVIALFLSKFRRRFIQRAVVRYKNYVFERVLGESISDFGGKTSAKLMSALSDGLQIIETDYLVGILNAFSIGFIFIETSRTILHMEAKLAVPIIAVTFISTVFTVVLSFMDHEGHHDRESSESISEQTQDLLGGFTVIKTFKAEKKIMDLFRHRSVGLKSDESGEGGSKILPLYIKLSTLFVNSVVFALGFWLAFTGEISIGMVIAFIYLKGFMLEPVKEYGHILVKLGGAVRKINEMNDMLERVEARKVAFVSEGLINIDSFADTIELENVSVAYDEEYGALHGVTLKLEKGKSYALVGTDNSGKTTLVKTLLSSIPNYEGTVRIDGHDLRHVNVDSLYDDITAIFGNEIFLFNGTVEDNITLFTSTDKDVFESAIKGAGLDELVKARGTKYPCGDFGKRLTNDERRRIAIARYLVKKTPVIIADELDYDLDGDKAASLLNTMLDIEDATRIIVTTHLDDEVMKRFDSIIVMSNYEVAEMGTYDELMAEKGKFYALSILYNE